MFLQEPESGRKGTRKHLPLYRRKAFPADKQRQDARQQTGANGQISLLWVQQQEDGAGGPTVHYKSRARFRDKMRELLDRMCTWAIEATRKRFNSVLMGWVNYYGPAISKSYGANEDGRIRSRICRMYLKKWKEYGPALKRSGLSTAMTRKRRGAPLEWPFHMKGSGQKAEQPTRF